MVEEGQAAPDFALPSDSGDEITLSRLRGSPVVIYFYPRDDTPGCTRQACGMRNAWAAFEERGATVLGISPDGPRSHAKFREKYGLPFTLLSDAEGSVADAYGVRVLKAFRGKVRIGIERSTFVIDADGNVVKVMRRVKPDTHAADVLAALPT